MKKLILATFLLFSAVVLPSPAFAEQTPNCTPIFGGGASCEYNPPISINKQVQNPSTKNYIDSLKVTDPQYAGGQTVLFKITVTNTGNSAVNNLAVVDTLPQFIDYTKGQGKYDAATRSLSFEIEQLKGKESKVYFIEARVAAANRLPDSAQARCVINQARVTANNKTSQDNTVVCLAKTTVAPTNPPTTRGGTRVFPPGTTRTTPDTGPAAWALAAMLPLGAFGVWLRKKA